MAEKEFVCGWCGKMLDFEMNIKECKMCHRTQCNECLNDEGMCIPCHQKS